MQLSALTALAMLAFAANSLLNRMAVGAGGMDPLDFALLRALTGAATLSALLMLQRRRLPLLSRQRIPGALALTIYLVGFSVAYRSIDAGMGALILFGGVQLTMFAGALALGEGVPPTRWAGSAVAMLGLACLVWPTGSVALPMGATGAMLTAALGWGAYSLLGRRSADPLAETGAHFVLAAPLCAVAWFFLREKAQGVGTDGLLLATLSGAVASGLGYALWYAVLPQLEVTLSSLIQLAVPVFALAGSVALLNEEITSRGLVGGLLTLGGIAGGLFGSRHRRASSRGR